MYDVVIVGAGVAGLVTAQRMLKQHPSIDILIIDGDSRIGGRTMSKEVLCADGVKRPFCFGAGWLNDSHTCALELMKELGLHTTPQYTVSMEGKHCFEIIESIRYYTDDKPVDPEALSDFESAMSKIEKDCEAIATANEADLQSLDESTVQRVKKLTKSEAAANLLLAELSTLIHSSIGEMSYLMLLKTAKSCGGLKGLLDSMECYRVAEGTAAISEGLAKKIGQNRIRLNCRVAQIDQNDQQSVRIIDANGKVIETKRVVMTVPSAQLVNVSFSPPLPQDRQSVLNNMKSCNEVKTFITYKTAFWRDLGFSGSISSYLGKPVCDRLPIAPIEVALDATSEDSNQPALVILSSAHTNFKSTPEQRRSDILAHLSRFFPAELVNDYVDYVDEYWSGSRSILLPGVTRLGLIVGDEMTRPVDRVHFAGSDFTSQWITFIEGAAQSGVRAADEVASALGIA